MEADYDLTGLRQIKREPSDNKHLQLQTSVPSLIASHVFQEKLLTGARLLLHAKPRCSNLYVVIRQIDVSD